MFLITCILLFYVLQHIGGVDFNKSLFICTPFFVYLFENLHNALFHRPILHYFMYYVMVVSNLPMYVNICHTPIFYLQSGYATKVMKHKSNL